MTFYKKLRNSVAALALLSSGMIAASSLADVVHLDDVIVTGSLCAGFDCVNGESFGFDTIRVKENNVRIHFQDTSASSSFPNNDWRIVINDSANGGANYFAIEDSNAGRMPFRVEAGARANALYVDSQGDVGLGTSTPVVELHIVDGDSPTIRLEQDASNGFTPQTYDVAANETNFFIRDVTNGSKLFFRARPNAPANSIYIAADGNIGFGTAAPSEKLHVFGGRIRIENSSNVASLQLDETGSTNSGGVSLFNNQLILAHDDGGTSEFVMDTDGNITLTGSYKMTETGSTTDAGLTLLNNKIILAHDDGGLPELRLDTSGNMVITGSITTNGSCSIGCDAVFDADYDLPTIEQHAEQMFAKKHLPVVGPTQSGPINLSDKMTAMLNELEKAHIYIAQINTEKNQLQARLQANEERLAKLEAKIAQ